jgi:hypothetical protein
MREGKEVKEDRDVIAEARKHLDENPTANFLDKVAGRVMDAADEVERRIGPLDEKEYAAVVAILADRAVMQIAESVAKRQAEAQTVKLVDPAKLRPVSVQQWEGGKMISEKRFDDDPSEHEIGCTCIFCIPGA